MINLVFFHHNAIVLDEPKRRVKDEAISRRQCNVRYYLPSENGQERVRVCQKTICNIFSITPRRLQILMEKLKQTKKVTDGRGLHKNRPHAITDASIAKVRERISSFPKMESHYSRKKTRCEYLSCNLNLNIMFKLFNDKKYPDVSISKRVYTNVFYSDFKLKFGIPRSDKCETCDALFIKMCAADNETEFNLLHIQSEMHHMRAEAAYSQLKDDQQAAKVSPNKTVVLFTDLEQVLYCSNLTHSSVFYQKQQ